MIILYILTGIPIGTDSPAPGPLDVIGAAVVVEGIGDMALNYGIFLGGLLGQDTEEMPSDLLNAAVSAITGSEEIGDNVQDFFDEGVDLLNP